MEKDIRVIIFDDNQFLLERVVAKIDENFPFKVVGAFPDCSKIIQRIEQLKPDIIVMDIEIPEVSGIDALRTIRKQFPDMPVLMLTAFHDDDKIFAAIVAGASGYVLKIDKDNLIEYMRDALNGGAPFSSVIAKRVLSLFQSLAGHPTTEFIDLSKREKEILQCMVKGMSRKMIAEACFISIETVHSHIKNIYEKLHVHSSSEAVAKSILNHLV